MIRYKLMMAGVLYIIGSSVVYADWGVIDEAAVERLDFIKEELMKINRVSPAVKGGNRVSQGGKQGQVLPFANP